MGESLESQRSLFLTHCSSKCKIYDLCGGGLSAPCSCIYKGEKRHQCKKCPYICLERRNFDNEVEGYISLGLSLEELRISPKPLVIPPIFVPMATRNAKSKLPLPWVGLEMEKLVGSRGVKSVLKLEDQAVFESYFKIKSRTNLIAVFNSTDKLLENFWGMPQRQRLFRLLKERGVLFATGPTFSVTDEVAGFPASHNVFMQRRHHKIIQEISDSGMIPIPNIYSRNKADIDNWVNWIIKNNIQIISRDFSLTTDKASFSIELSKFMELLVQLKRFDKGIHVILLGVGSGNSKKALKNINSLGFTGSIISKDPIITAIKAGKKMILDNLGHMSKISDNKTPKEELIQENIQVFTKYLNSCSSAVSTKTTS